MNKIKITTIFFFCCFQTWSSSIVKANSFKQTAPAVEDRGIMNIAPLLPACLPACLSDNTEGREVAADGPPLVPKHIVKRRPINAQHWFISHVCEEYWPLSIRFHTGSVLPLDYHHRAGWVISPPSPCQRPQTICWHFFFFSHWAPFADRYTAPFIIRTVKRAGFYYETKRRETRKGIPHTKRERECLNESSLW